MNYRYNVELDNRDFTGHVVSGINLNVSQVFDNTLILKFKLQTNQHQVITCAVPCMDRNHAHYLKSRLKKSRLESNVLKITAADLNHFYLVGEGILISKHGKELLEIPDDSLKITSDTNHNSDEEFDKHGRAGIVSHLAEHKDLNGNPYFSFDFKLIPHWNANLDDSTSSCVMYPQDVGLSIEEIRFNIKQDQKREAALSYQIVGEDRELNIIGKPTLFRVSDYRYSWVPKSKVRRLFSQKIRPTDSRKNDLSLILRLNHQNYQITMDKDNGSLVFSSPRPLNRTHFSSDTVLVLKALEMQEQMGATQMQNHNCFISLPMVDKFTNFSEAHNIAEIQTLINNGIVKLVDQTAIPKDFDNAEQS